MFWVELIPAVTFFFALLFIPESPRFLVAAGKKAKAIAILTRLCGEDEFLPDTVWGDGPADA